MARKLCAALAALIPLALATSLAQQYQQPAPSYQQPPPAYQQPAPAYQQPAPAYQQAPPSYQQPAPGYQAPPPGYPQQPNYQQPPAGSQPAPNYQQPPAAPAPRYPPPVWKPVPPQFRYHPLRAQIEGGYTITAGAAKEAIHDGGNLGLGVTWFPSPTLPLGLRVDGSYSSFHATSQALAMASEATGTNVAFGHQNVYGGDADAELDLPMGPSVREYFFGGFGWYREQTVFKQLSYEPALICFFYCYPGYFGVVSTVERNTSAWLKSWNAGMGFEFALADPVSFFVEARYLRIQPYNANTAFVPIRVGLRF